ncbi:MAG: cupin domain-containing protein [Propionibacterium sp.]|nr:cupin domain-containing protein [Propionibacterium sp.]
MQLLPKRPTGKGSPERFTGDVYVTAHADEPDARTGLALVRFTPAARTAWHSHAAGQLLHCTEGLGLVVTRDTVVVLRPGDTAWTPPGELHWHGALDDSFMSHLALTGTLDPGSEGPATAWGDHVTDTDYAAACGHAH